MYLIKFIPCITFFKMCNRFKIICNRFHYSIFIHVMKYFNHTLPPSPFPFIHPLVPTPKQFPPFYTVAFSLFYSWICPNFFTSNK
jgi:hypothetical protein